MIPQDPPFAIQIELVEGCTLQCEFCGINGIREKPGNFKFMTLPMVHTLSGQLQHAIRYLQWNPRLEFAMHGEPSMHPQLIEAIGTIRRAVGQKISMVMFSNGSGFLKNPGLIDELLEAGLNTLGLDAYEHVNIVPRLMEHYRERPYPADVFYYPQEKQHNLHTGRRVGRRDIVIIQDISKAETGNHSSLNTHCGGGMQPEGLPIKARCAKPFRELAIRWDGSVALCCNDFRGIYKISNIQGQSLEQVWNDPRFVAARKRLYHYDRDFGPCRYCNAKSMRVGLLPDHKGHQTLEPASEEDHRIIEEACGGESFTTPVLRAWELDVPLFRRVEGRVYAVNLQDQRQRRG